MADLCYVGGEVVSKGSTVERRHRGALPTASFNSLRSVGLRRLDSIERWVPAGRSELGSTEIQSEEVVPSRAGG